MVSRRADPSIACRVARGAAALLAGDGSATGAYFLRHGRMDPHDAPDQRPNHLPRLQASAVDLIHARRDPP